MPRTSNFPAAPELYCITDTRLSGLTHEAQVAQMIAGGARIIQLRDKEVSDVEFSTVAEKCQSLCRAAGVLFVVNDRIEIAATIGADGLHLGQDDISPAEARRIVGTGMVIGISTHNREQFLRALKEPVNYIALGPVFGTTTKARPDPPPGMDLVREAASVLNDDLRPLVLIGGVMLENLPQLQTIAPRAIIAVVGAIVAKKFSIADRVKMFRDALLGEQRPSV